MKRLLLMLGIPALMGLVWFGGTQRGPSATASVSIDSPKVIALRSTVISRLTGVGAVKTAESTSYSGGGESDLTFRIPPARIEEALIELNSVGGTVVEQKVQLEDLADTAQGLSVGLDGIDGCLGNLATDLASRQVSTDDVSKCQARLDVVSKDLESTPAPVQDAVVNVHLRRASTTSPFLLVAVIVLAIALAAMAYLTFRSAQVDRMIDLSESHHPTAIDELYTRRN